MSEELKKIVARKICQHFCHHMLVDNGKRCEGDTNAVVCPLVFQQASDLVATILEEAAKTAETAEIVLEMWEGCPRGTRAASGIEIAHFIRQLVGAQERKKS